MKKVFMLLSVALFAIACVDKNDEATLKDSQKINLNHAITTKEYTIPVQAGMLTVVRGEDNNIIAIDSVANQILVPTEGTLKVSYVAPNHLTQFLDSLNVDATTGDANHAFTSAGTYSLWQTIAFEDLVIGDYDYNDLIIHCRYQMKSKELRIGIQPIALGGTLRLRLGCDIYKGNTPIKTGIIVADNCRQNMFNGQGGYLNTQTHNFENTVTGGHMMKKVVKYLFSDTEMNNTGAISVNWYIEVFDRTGSTVTNRFNAISTHYVDNNMLDANSNPYGLVITHTGKVDTQYGQTNYYSGHDWFNYPLEKTKIYTVYTSWLNWLKTSNPDFATMYNQGWTSEGVFQAGQLGLYVIKLGYQDLWDSWTNDILIDANSSTKFIAKR